MYHVNLGGGERIAKSALQNHFWKPQKLGLVWSVPCQKRGETYRRWGGGLLGSEIAIRDGKSLDLCEINSEKLQNCNCIQ